METSIVGAPALPCATDKLTETIKQRLLKQGLNPTPKIIHTLRKKHHQKALRKSKKLTSQTPLEPLQNDHELHFKTISQEYKAFSKAVGSKVGSSRLVGRPWEPLEMVKFREVASGCVGKEEKLKFEHLRELGLMFEERKVESLRSFLDDDVEVEEGGYVGGFVSRRRVGDGEAIRILLDRLSAREITMKDWKFTRIMKQSGLQFTEDQLLKVVGGLGERGCWKQAMEVVEWVYGRKEHKNYKSRFVYTKLLAVLGKTRRPHEALQIFKHMRADCNIYPDMAAYRSISVTLGQAGMVRELMSIVESMKEKPSKSIKNMHRKNWDPTLQPDIVVFNSVLNACIPSHHWKGVAWVFQQLRKGGLQANSATYGLAMEVMLQSSKYDLVHELFQKMKKSGNSPNALTYKVLVRAFWKEGKVDAAIHVVREMEQRGIRGSASVYYELACCLCSKGRWQEAMTEVAKLKRLRHSKPLAVAFTGMILSSMDGGYVDGCISIFEHMQGHCPPNIGSINAMLKVYGRHDMFLEAKELFEKVKRAETGDRECSGDDDTPLVPDIYTYGSILEASAHAYQWEYFEFVYKEMCFSGYQLDQGRHAALLIEASRAGKWHLLEHAFDTTLEAGEIPHPILFTELICQAIFLGHYEKAATIVKTMAYAPFQFNKKDWLGLFEKNKDKISGDHLEKLSDTLCNHDMPEESTALELRKALNSICGSKQNKSTCACSLSFMSSSESSLDVKDSNVAQNTHIQGETVICTTADESFKDVMSSCDQFSVGSSGDERGSLDAMLVVPSSSSCDGDKRATSCDNLLSFIDMACDEYFENTFDELQASDVSDSEDDEYDDPDLPSAEEILQSWKKVSKENKTSLLVS